MIRRIFITGLVAVIPFVITAYVVIALFTFADSILGEVINNYLVQYLGYRIPGLGIILSILIIFLLGLLLKLSRMTLARFVESFILKIPLVKNIYVPIKKVVHSLFLLESTKFKGVVLVEYPRKGIYSIGFVTNESPKEFKDKVGRKLYTVFIGSSPSPLTGFIIAVPEDEVIVLNMTVEEAIRIIVSGGMIDPDEDMA